MADVLALLICDTCETTQQAQDRGNNLKHHRLLQLALLMHRRRQPIPCNHYGVETLFFDWATRTIADDNFHLHRVFVYCGACNRIAGLIPAYRTPATPSRLELPAYRH